MVQEEIVLEHVISTRGIEMDKAKVQVTERLPLPTSVKGVRSFLNHTGFHCCFIKDFSKITKLLTYSWAKILFTNECLQAFERIKEDLILVPIIQSLDWMLPFELMCDTSDFGVREVLGQRGIRCRS